MQSRLAHGVTKFWVASDAAHLAGVIAGKLQVLHVALLKDCVPSQDASRYCPLVHEAPQAEQETCIIINASANESVASKAKHGVFYVLWMSRGP